MIFIDADAFIALNVQQDAHHTRAVSLLSTLEKRKESLMTSWDVVDEVVTKLSYFTTHAHAEQFFSVLIASDIQIAYVAASLVPQIRERFTRQTSKRVSLTDCANMVIAEQFHVQTFFSFDDHYRQNHFHLIH